MLINHNYDITQLNWNAAYLKKKNISWMKTIHYLNTLRSHLVTIVPMALFTLQSALKLRSACTLDIRLSSAASIPALILRNPNNHYNHGFPNTFDYNHYVYSDYLVYSLATIAHIIRYCVFVTLLQL